MKSTKNTSAITLLKKEYERFLQITSRGYGARLTTTFDPRKIKGGFLNGESSLLMRIFIKEFS